MSQDDLLQSAYARLDAKIESEPAKKSGLSLWAFRTLLENDPKDLMIINIIKSPFQIIFLFFMLIWSAFVWFPCAFLVCMPYCIFMGMIGRTEFTKVEEWLLYYVFGWQIFEAIVNDEF
jgi:hypothetical protein